MFIHSLVDGILGCVHVLAILHNAIEFSSARLWHWWPWTLASPLHSVVTSGKFPNYSSLKDVIYLSLKGGDIVFFMKLLKETL